jgi:hypothetical protein
MKLLKRLKSREKLMIVLVAIFIILAVTLLLMESLQDKNRMLIKLGEDITLSKNNKEYVKIEKNNFDIELIAFTNNTCPKDAMCQLDYFEITLRINSNNYELGAGYGSKKPESINIKGTNYNVKLNSKYIKNKAIITIISLDEEKANDNDILEMAEVDNYIYDIVNSDNYKSLSEEAKIQVLKTELDILATTGTENFNYPLIRKETINFADNLYSFEYACGALGGVLISEDNPDYLIDNNMNQYDSQYSVRGIYYDTLNEPNAPHFYTIAMGMQNSGGYNIEIEKVNIDENNNVEVLIKETIPSPDVMTTSAITYPICKLTLNENPKSIVFKNTDGQKFENINQN